MSVRLPLAFLLGVATAVLVACGGSNKKLLPAVSADRLKNDLADISQAINQQDCSAAGQAFNQFQADLQRVPPSVDRRLRQRLNEGATRLSARVPVDCKGSPPTTTTTVPTTTTTTPTTTTPTTTTPTPTTPTTTTTTPTTPTTTPTDTTTTDGGSGSGGVTAP
jgi:cell division septation protein DedD